MSSTYLDEIAAVLRRAEAIAYERGKADAKRELLEFLRQKDAQIASPPEPHKQPSTEEVTQQRPVDERQRAPKGVARKLAMRTLYSAQKPMTAAAILERAATDFEKMVKPASMRSELRNGKREMLYVDNSGAWSLTQMGRETIEAEGVNLDIQPSASDDNNNGGSNAAALDLRD